MVFTKLLGRPLKPAAKAPDFELADQNGKIQRLSEHLGKWVILYFYPKDKTFGCTREACSFRDTFKNFAEQNVQIFGVSADSIESHKEFAAQHQLPFSLLADTRKKTCKDYGVLSAMGFPMRVTFIIDPSGKIADRLSWVNWYRYGEVVLKRLQELQGTPNATGEQT